MINEICLENFKSFKNSGWLNIKPVTILCGTNSCGKSTILQSILAFRQTLESQNPNQTILLNGRLTHLGSFENIIYDKKIENAVSFAFKIRINKHALRKFFKPSEMWALSRELFPVSERIKEYHIECKISLKSSEVSEQLYLKPITVPYLKFHTKALSDNTTDVSESLVEIIHKYKNEYRLIWKNLNVRRHFSGASSDGEGDLTTQIEFSNLLPILRPSRENERNFWSPSIYMRKMIDFLRSAFSTYTYIGPLREEPSRRYIYEDEVVEIGVKGENAAHIYLAEQDKKISDNYFYDNVEDSFYEKDKISLSDGVQDWLDKMNIRALQPESSREIIYLKLNAGESNPVRVNIADVGFGVSQVFPIVLEGLRMPVGNTLILEQPEIHLHPKLQMQIADYCIALSLSGKKVIAETHSDHIVNRLVRRIIEDKDNKLKDMIGIYFIKPSPEGSVLEEITIDENRGIVNWPAEFFDQFSDEQQKIMKAGLAKRKKLRKGNSDSENEHSH